MSASWKVARRMLQSQWKETEISFQSNVILTSLWLGGTWKSWTASPSLNPTQSVVAILTPAAAAARGGRGGAPGAVVDLAFAVRRLGLAAAAAVERELVAAYPGGFELALEDDEAVGGGFADTVRRLGLLAAAGFSTLLLAAHHIDASELGAHVLGFWLCGGSGRSVSLGGGGSGRAAVVIAGLWDCEIVSFSCSGSGTGSGWFACSCC